MWREATRPAHLPTLIATDMDVPLLGLETRARRVTVLALLWTSIYTASISSFAAAAAQVGYHTSPLVMYSTNISHILDVAGADRTRLGHCEAPLCAVHKKSPEDQTCKS